jgi:hypothetical protein
MVELQAQPWGFSYSLNGVRSSSVADFRMASAICRTKWSGLARPYGRSGFIAASLIDWVLSASMSC